MKTVFAKHKPTPLSELKSASRPIKNPNIEHYENLSQLEKVALTVTKRVGTFGFFILIALWTLVWIIWNTFGPEGLRFDPFPAFVLWLFVSNLIQIMLMPLIMVGQNLQGKHSEARAEADFEVNVKAEKEIETILQHLENQNELILEILRRLEREKIKYE